MGGRICQPMARGDTVLLLRKSEQSTDKEVQGEP